MASTIKVLANGTLGTGVGSVYSPTGTKSALITGITFMNKIATAQTVTWYVVPGGVANTEARIGVSPGMAQNTSDKINDVITLSGADQLAGGTTSVSAVDFAVYGIERD